MPRIKNIDDITWGGMRATVIATLRAIGKDFTKCEFCFKKLTRYTYRIHHKKYDGATIYDLAIICKSCDMKKENRYLL